MTSPLAQLTLGSEDAPDRAVTHLARTAHANDDTPTLVQLARRTHLPCDVHALLQASTQREVRSNYLRRADLDTDTVVALLQDETDPLHLMTAAAYHDDPRIHALIAAHVRAHPDYETFNVLLPTVRTPHVAAFALQWMARDAADRPDPDRHLADRVMLNLPDVIRIAAPDADALEPILALLPFTLADDDWRTALLGDETLPDVIRLAALQTQLHLAPTWACPDQAVLSTARTMLTIHQSRPVLRALSDACHAYRTDDPGDDGRDDGSDERAGWAAVLEALAARLAYPGPDTDTLRHAGQHAATSTDPAQLQDIAEYILHTGAFIHGWGNRIAAALAANPHLDPATAHRLQIRARRWPLTSLHDLSAALLAGDPADPDVRSGIDSLVAAWPAHSVTTGLIDRTADPAAALQSALAGHPINPLDVVADAVVAAGRTDLAQVLPLRLLTTPGTDRSRRWMAGILSIAADHLGADPDRWTAFDTLSRDFPGTLGELLRAVDHAIPCANARVLTPA